MTFNSLVVCRVVGAAVLASTVALAVSTGATAGPALWTLSAQPASAHAGATGFQTFHITMTPPAAAVATPKGFMTVRMSGSSSPIWCFPDTGTLCYMTYGGPNLLDVHIYMTKIAAKPGAMRLQLQEPKPSQPPIYYSTPLVIPIVANSSAGGANVHGALPHPVGPIQSLKPQKPIPATPAPTKT